MQLVYFEAEEGDLGHSRRLCVDEMSPKKVHGWKGKGEVVKEGDGCEEHCKGRVTEGSMEEGGIGV